MCFRKKKVAEKNEPVVKQADAKPKEVKEIYHISQNKDDKSEHFKKWRVRKEGSDKTIKFFDTQKEAIDYANSLCKNNDASIKIHKVDGKIRK